MGRRFPPPGDLPNSGVKSMSPVSRALQVDFFFFFLPTEASGKPGLTSIYIKKISVDHKLIETNCIVIPVVHLLLNNNVWEQEVILYENSSKNGMILKSFITCKSYSVLFQ